jgi:hypothetical protein
MTRTIGDLEKMQPWPSQRDLFSASRKKWPLPFLLGAGALPPYRTEVQKSRDEGMKIKSLVEKIRLGLIEKRMNGYNI